MQIVGGNSPSEDENDLRHFQLFNYLMPFKISGKFPSRALPGWPVGYAKTRRDSNAATKRQLQFNHLVAHLRTPKRPEGTQKPFLS